MLASGPVSMRSVFPLGVCSEMSRRLYPTSSTLTLRTGGAKSALVHECIRGDEEDKTESNKNCLMREV
jgi:hypothetical protein